MGRHILIDALGLAPGGGAVVLDRIAAALLAEDARATVLTGRDLPGPGERRHIGAGAARARLWRRTRLRRALRDLDADAVLTFGMHAPARVPQAALHINAIPFLPFAQRARAVGPLRAGLLGAEARRALRRSDANIFESDHLRSLAVRHGPIRGALTAPVGAELASAPGAPMPHRILCVTSGARHKRNDVALGIFRRYRRLRPGATLHLIGPPDAIAASLDDADRAALHDDPSIHLAGRLDRTELHAALGRGWALVAPSEIESFYMVALEAMGAGCPAVGFERSSMRESVGPDMPLAPPGDADAAAHLLAALDADRPRLSAAARAWARRLPARACAGRIARAVLEATDVAGRQRASI